jgi:hypothetical protein
MPPKARITLAAYLGMTAGIEKWGKGSQEVQTLKLNWQKSVNDETKKIKQFQEVAGALQEFKTYLFVKKGSTYCTVLHSPMKFVAISDTTLHLHGRFICFVEDQTLSCVPTPNFPPHLKTWQWVKGEVCMEGQALLDYYKEGVTHWGKLRSLDGEATKEETFVPRLHAIPPALLDKIGGEGQYLMPLEVLRLVILYLKTVANEEVAEAWLLIASGSSWRRFGTLDDRYLCKVPLPRAPQIQSPGHVTCATVTECDKSDTGYLQVQPIPTWSDLLISRAGFARSTMLQLAPVYLL